MSVDLKSNIKNNIKKENNTPVSNTNVKDENENKEQVVKTFKIGKKQEDKSNKKSFPLYVEEDVQKKLDKISQKTKYSRNEIINMMINHCLENIEFVD